MVNTEQFVIFYTCFRGPIIVPKTHVTSFSLSYWLKVLCEFFSQTVFYVQSLILRRRVNYALLLKNPTLEIGVNDDYFGLLIYECVSSIV